MGITHIASGQIVLHNIEEPSRRGMVDHSVKVLPSILKQLRRPDADLPRGATPKPNQITNVGNPGQKPGDKLDVDGFLLRQGVEGERQPRLVTRGGVMMQNAFVNRVVNQFHGGLQQRQRGGLVLCFECGAELSNLITQARSMHLILFVAFFSLRNAL